MEYLMLLVYAMAIALVILVMKWEAKWRKKPKTTLEDKVNSLYNTIFRQ